MDEKKTRRTSEAHAIAGAVVTFLIAWAEFRLIPIVRGIDARTKATAVKVGAALPGENP